MSQELVMEPEVSAKDDLDRVRNSAQELHQAITSVLAKRAAATRVDSEHLIQQARESAELASSAIGAKYDVAEEQITQHLKEAAEKLRGAHKEAAKSLESSGQECRAFLTSALAEARAATQKVSEAIAARRSGQSGE